MSYGLLLRGRRPAQLSSAMCTAPRIFENQSAPRRAPLEVCVTKRAQAAPNGPGLLDSARAGDREALARLLMPYAAGLYLSALRVTGNPSDAEDVRQEAMLRAVSRLRQFAGSQNAERDDLQAWVSRIGANASIDVIRRRKEGKIISLEQPAGDSEETLGSGIAAREENPEERLARREMRALLAASITQLPADLRQVCLLQDVLHYSTQEVAERLGISAVAVRLRLFRARRKLREKMRHRLRFPQPQAARAASYSAAPSYEFAGAPEFACGD
jgi:RNA polymerase sigma-70 factor, ECF subfamily